MQRYIIYLFLWNSIKVSGGSISSTVVEEMEQFDKVPDAVYTVFELLMMGGGTAWNM